MDTPYPQNKYTPSITLLVEMSEINKPDLLSKEDIRRLPTYEREHYIKDIIRKTIHLNPNGVTAKQVSKNLEIDPRIVDKYVSILVHTNEIYVEYFDEKAVYFPNTRLLHPISEQRFPISEDMDIQLLQLKNRLGEFVFIQTKKKTEYREDVGSGILVPLEKFPDFVEYLKKVLTDMIKLRSDLK